MSAETLARIQHKLRRFATTNAAGKSPLYAHLAQRCAEDEEIAGLLAATSREFQTATLLFAAVHRVLQANPINELANYYPSVGGSYGVDDGTWPLFRSFVLDHREAVRELIATRTTQTNEVRRCALLYPAVAMAAGRRPVGLLEVGCSAGLLLGLDRYAYRYQTQQAGQLVAGPAKATVGLHCALEVADGATLPTVPKKIDVRARVGLDRAPVDLTDEDQYAWLEACIWPDQVDRSRLFTAAARAQAQRGNRPELIAGDAIDDLATAAAHIPDELPIVVLTSNFVIYLPAPRRAEFVAALADLAASRPVYWVTHDEYEVALRHVLPGRDDLNQPKEGSGFGILGLVHWADGKGVGRALARTAWHGERMVWLGDG